METINREKKEQHIGELVSLDIGKHNTALIARIIKINLKNIRIDPKTIIFTDKLLKEYAQPNKIFQISLQPLFQKQFTSKSTKRWVNLDISKFGSWRSVTDNQEHRGGSRILTNEVKVPASSGIINDSQIRPKIALLKNQIQDQKRSQRHLIEDESVQNKVYQTSSSPLPHKPFVSTLTENRKHKGVSQIQTNEVGRPVFSDLINDSQKLSETELIKNHTQARKLKKVNLMESEVVHYPKSDSEIDKKKESLEKKAEQSSYFYLDSSVKDFVAGILNIRIPPVKIYANQTSDSLTKQFNADALTYKNNIFFRTGKYNPRDKKGIALLGHELTHAAQIKMQNQNSAGSKIIDYEYGEREAIGNEKSVLRYFLSAEPYGKNKRVLDPNSGDNSFKEYRFNSEAYRSYKSSASPSSFLDNSTSTINHHTQTQIPRTAPTSRDLDLPLETSTNSNPTFKLSEQQLRLIKDDIYRDIMNRIRIEFERGG
jgi:hypothetical protein